MPVTVQQPKKRKRVPDALRRRAAISCDRCKLRRVKCIRTEGQEACNSCLSSRVKCLSTLPRKQRVYGSLESLSLRYRALEALVKGLFPDENTQDIGTLYSIAAERGISMPSSDDESPMLDIFAQESSLQHESLRPPSLHPDVDAAESTGSNLFGGKQVERVVEEKLIPSPNGAALYIGPSSSFLFASVVRTLVARCGASPCFRQPRRHKAERAEFITLRTSKALQIRTEDQDSSSRDGQTSAVSARPEPLLSHRQPVKSLDPQPEQPATFQDISSGDRLYTIEEFLPNRAIADAAVRAFFDKVHSDYAIFHRSTFQVRYEALWERKKSALKEVDPGWITCLAMVFVLGSQMVDEYEVEEAPQIQKRYTTLARSATTRLISTSSLLNVQALMVLVLYEHNAGERNAAWMLLGCASRMAVALGMHRESTTANFDPVERNTRKRVWWTLYLLERNLCMILGRPSSIDESEVNVFLPDESMFDAMETPPGYVHQLVLLSRISTRVKQKIFGLGGSGTYDDDQQAASRARQLLHELETWRSELPPHLQPSGGAGMPAKQKRAVNVLQVYYFYIQSLIGRPCLLDRVRAEISQMECESMAPPLLSDDVQYFSQLCVLSAEQMIHYLTQLSSTGLFNGITWLDAYYVYYSIFVLCLDLLVRPANSFDSAEDLSRKATVKSISDVIRRTKLAPTYQILIQVANQFAVASGALDDTRDTRGVDLMQSALEQTKTSAQIFPSPVHTTEIRPHEMQHTPMGESIQPQLPWDFFDLGHIMPSVGPSGDASYPYFNESVMSMPAIGTFSTGSHREEGVPVMSESDDWASRTFRHISRG